MDRSDQGSESIEPPDEVFVSEVIGNSPRARPPIFSASSGSVQTLSFACLATCWPRLQDD